MKKILVATGIVLIVFGIYLLLREKPKIQNPKPKIEEVIKREKKEILRFAVMADVHNDTESLSKALDLVENELVVVAGDLTINGTEKEQMAIKKVLGDRFAVPGNHDIYKSVWIFGRKYQSIEKNNVKLILVDNSHWRGLGEEQKIWIGGEVGECVIKKCLAIMHKPLENHFSTHVMGENSKVVTAEAGWLKELFLRNNVRTGYSGHLHYASSYTIGGWETVLVGAISKDRNTETPRFTEVVVYDDGSVSNEVKLIQ